MASKKSVRSLMLADLERSGLDEQDIETMGLEAWEPTRTAKEFPYAGAVPAYKIPYPKNSKTYRVRVLAAPELPFGAVSAKPLTRYWQPPKTRPAAYFPNQVDDWAPILSSPEQRLLIVEGEKKAAKACKEGFNTIGLGGVFSFGCKAAGQKLLPELASIQWEHRNVYICFDSDASTNDQVSLAIKRLSDVLTDRGAIVHVATMPSDECGSKVGIDDYLVKYKKSKLEELLASAPMGDLAQKLLEFNEKWAVVCSPPCVLDAAMHTGEPRLYSYSQFTNLVASNISATETYLTAGGEERTRQVEVAERWLKYGARRQYSSITYAPGHAKVLADGTLNAWRGLGVEPKQGDVKPWKELLDHLFTGAPKGVRSWFECWCGYPIKFLGAKLQSAVGLWSAETGVGKSLAARTLGYLYGDNYVAISQDDLESDFNQWAINRQFVLVDEVSAADTRKRADKFKSLLTQEKIWLNPKGVQQYPIPDHVNYFLTSNHPNAFYVEDNDRRFFIHKVEVPALPREFYAHYCHDWLGIPRPNGQANIGGPKGPGPSALLYYFQHELDYGSFDPAERPPVTQAKLDMMNGVRAPVDAWLVDCASSALLANRDLWSADELVLAYNSAGMGRGAIAPNVFIMHLAKRFRCVGEAHVPPKGMSRVYAIRNMEKWLAATDKERTEHIAKGVRKI